MTRPPRRMVSSRSRKPSSGGRLRRTSCCGNGKSITACSRCASHRRCSVVVGVTSIVPRSNAPVCPKSRFSARFGRLLAKLGGGSDKGLDPGLLNRSLQALAQRHLGLPPEDLASQSDVGLALLRIVGREGLVDDL